MWVDLPPRFRIQFQQPFLSTESLHRSQCSEELSMKTIAAFAFAMVVATGAALAQGSGGSGSGGTSAGPGGTNTGKDAAGMNPTVEQCKKGWDSSMRMTKAEFDANCAKK
jgi:hypothetical protein